MGRGWGGPPAAPSQSVEVAEDEPPVPAVDSDPAAGGDRSESGARFSSGQGDFPALGGSSRPGKPKPKLAGQWGRPKDAAKTTEQNGRAPAAEAATCAAAQPVQDADASILRVDETAAKVQDAEEDVADAQHAVEDRQCGDGLQDDEAGVSSSGASPPAPLQGLARKEPCPEEAAATGPTDSREITSVVSDADVDAASSTVVPEAPKFEHELDGLQVDSQKVERDEPETFAEAGATPAEVGEAPAEAHVAPEAPQDGASAALIEASKPGAPILTEELFPVLAASRPSAKRAPDATPWQKNEKSARKQPDQVPSHLGKWAKPLVSKAQGRTRAPTAVAAVSDASGCDLEPPVATVGQPPLASDDLEPPQPEQQELSPEEAAPAVPVDLDSAEAASKEADVVQVLQPSLMAMQPVIDEGTQPNIAASPATASPVPAVCERSQSKPPSIPDALGQSRGAASEQEEAEANACQASSAAVATDTHTASSELPGASSSMSMPAVAATEASSGDATATPSGDAIATPVQGAAPSQVAQPTAPAADAGAKSAAAAAPSLQGASSQAGRRQAQAQKPQRETGRQKAPPSQTLPEAAPVKPDPRLGKWCKPLFANSGGDAAPIAPPPPEQEPSAAQPGVTEEKTDVAAADSACGDAAPGDILPATISSKDPVNALPGESAPALAAPLDEAAVEQEQQEASPDEKATMEGKERAPEAVKAVEPAEEVLSPANSTSVPDTATPKRVASPFSARAATSSSTASPSIEAVKGGTRKGKAAARSGDATNKGPSAAASSSLPASETATATSSKAGKSLSSATSPQSASSEPAAKKTSSAPPAQAPKSAASAAPAAKPKATPKKPAAPPPSEVLTDAFGPALGAAPKKTLASAWARLTKDADVVRPEPCEKEPEEASTAVPEDAGDAVPAATHEVDVKETTMASATEGRTDSPRERTAPEGHDGESAKEEEPLEVEDPTEITSKVEEEEAKADVPEASQKEEVQKEEEEEEEENEDKSHDETEKEKDESNASEQGQEVQDEEQRHGAEKDDDREAGTNQEGEEKKEKGQEESAAADADTQAAEAAVALKPIPAESEFLARPDRAMEDIETADSSGTGLKGEVEQTDEEPSDEEARDSDADGTRDPPVRPAQAGAPYSPARSCPPETQSSVFMDIVELVRWREAVESTPELNCIHCVAVGIETTELAAVSRTPLARTPSHTDRTPSSKTFSRNSFRGNNLPQRTPKGSARRGDRRDREEQEPLQPLEVSSSSWVAQQRHWREERDQQQTDQSGNAGIGDTMITRRIRAILNKLTVEKFVTLLEQLTSCGISTKEHLEILIHEIMEKATTQHHFIPMYTQLCTVLNDWCSENQIGDGSKGSFKRILLNECQNSFERYLKPPQHLKDLKGEERDEAEVKYKTARVGNIRFVGELLARNMVASTVIVAVTKELLAKPEVPELLESLAAFLTTVGSLFDRPDWKHRDVLEKVFKDIRHLSRDSAVPSRIRCLLSDVLDLRAAGWQDQKMATTSVEGPMTLEQVHTRAAESSSRQNGGGQPRSQRSWSDSGAWSTPATPAGRYQRSNSYATADGWTTARATPKASLARVAETAVTSQKAATSSASSARAVVKELTISHDIDEALEAMKELRIPAERQPAEFAKMVAQAAEEASAKPRQICFSFVVQVFVTGLFEKSQLVAGIEKLCKRLEDLQSDVPALAEIIREEWFPALEELVQQGFLTTQRHEALVEATSKLFR